MLILLAGTFFYWAFDQTKNKVIYTDNSAWAEHSSSPFIFTRILGGYTLSKLKPLPCSGESDPALGQTILELITEDQSSREDGLSIAKAYIARSKTDAFLEDIILADTNFDPCRLGKLRADNVFFFVQHTDDVDIRSKSIPVLKDWADKGFLAKANLAAAIDRQRVSNGQAQLYGTDFTCDTELRRAVATNIERPQELNKRLQDFGMPPFYVIGRWANTMICEDHDYVANR